MKIALTCFSTVDAGQVQRLLDAGVGPALRHLAEHVAARAAVSAASGTGRPGPARHERVDDHGVDHRAAGADLAQAP